MKIKVSRNNQKTAKVFKNQLKKQKTAPAILKKNQFSKEEKIADEKITRYDFSNYQFTEYNSLFKEIHENTYISYESKNSAEFLDVAFRLERFILDHRNFTRKPKKIAIQHFP